VSEEVRNMIKIRFNVGSKPHTETFENYEDLGIWIVKNYRFRIIYIDVEEH
jgi:hypothetical protein